MSRRDEIRTNSTRNINRVRNLALIYKTFLSGTGSGRRDVESSDVLRASTVMLHATLEDFLRELAQWKLPHTNADYLKEISISGSEGKAQKFDLSSLAKFRGKTVSDVIEASVKEHLAQSTYNNVHDVKKLLSAIGLDGSKFDRFWINLGRMMDRRHNIVHRADKNENTGVGHYSAKSLSHAAVIKWIDTVEGFIEETLKNT